MSMANSMFELDTGNMVRQLKARIVKLEARVAELEKGPAQEIQEQLNDLKKRVDSLWMARARAARKTDGPARENT